MKNSNSFHKTLTDTLQMLEDSGLFANINKRRRRGISRSKKKSTIDPQTYDDMRTWGDDINKVIEVIQEAFDQPADIKWIKQTDDFWKGRFYIDDPKSDHSYSYEIDIMKLDADSPAWDISFYLTDHMNDDESEGQNWATYHVTGTGKATIVFATVLTAINQWIQAVKPSVFNLSAIEDNRVKLYHSLFKRFLPKGWNYAYVNGDFWAARKADPEKIAKKYSL